MKHALLAAIVTTTFLGLNGCAWFGGGSDEAPSTQTGSNAGTASQPSDEALKACGADRLKALTGARLDQNVRQHIVDQSQAQQFRVLAPDTMKTMDYRQDRLNIHVNEQGVIQSFSCG
ncbi:I78 family peptidase inhibitor [uncultured Kushneria sp.]|uniref:I78 family peptidase inhibitor n=1 Tax=uncultured Kushneria sp. TaxID=905033 RepID=UPI0026036141|nr:I78 family peptidase inhibitor [uncultured Kushneria sp.]